jgi:hypothetical protein
MLKFRWLEQDYWVSRQFQRVWVSVWDWRTVAMAAGQLQGTPGSAQGLRDQSLDHSDNRGRDYGKGIARF